MPSGGTRSRNGSCLGGTARCTAASTLSYCCGPVTARTDGIFLRDAFRLRAHAAGDDHLAVGGERLADGGKRLLLGAVEEAAGIHHHEVGAFVLARELIALGPQARDDALGVHQRLGAAERHEADFRRRRRIGRGRGVDDGFR